MPRTGQPPHPQHSPLITSATRRVPVPSRLMTPKHLEGGAEGRTGQPGNNQTLRGGATTTPPKFKKQSLKGRAQAVGTATPWDTQPTANPDEPIPEVQNFSNCPKQGGEGVGRGSHPQLPRLSFAPPQESGGGRAVICRTRPSSAKILHSQDVQQRATAATMGLVKESSSESQWKDFSEEER